MKQDSTTKQVTSAITDGWMEGGSFFGSILAGTLLGFFADRWLDTAPLFVIVGILLGAYSGFLHVWQYSKKLDDQIRER